MITRKELRATWEMIQNTPGNFDPEVDEQLDLIRAGGGLEVVTPERAEALRARVRKK